MAKSNTKEKEEILDEADKEEQQTPPEKTQDDVIHEIMDRVEDNSAKVEKLVDDLVDKYCHQLDELVSAFKEVLHDKDNPITEEELDEICLKLPSYLYFIGEAQERFGIKEDIAKSVKMELYNQVHQRTRGTIADKQAASEAATLEEDIVFKAYQRSYKRIKQKLEAAYELLASIKKVISRRETEMQLSGMKLESFRR